MVRPTATTSKFRYKIGSKTRSKAASQFRCLFKGFGTPFCMLLGTFWCSKAVPNSVMILGCSFVGVRDAAWLRRIVDAPSTRLRRKSRCRGSPLGGAPFARGESYKRLGSQAPRPKSSLPKASQASQTRSNTQWARGPAIFFC